MRLVPSQGPQQRQVPRPPRRSAVHRRQKNGSMVDRSRRELTDEDMQKVAGAYHAWREGKGYEDVPGFCKSASIEEIREHRYVLTPGRYVGVEDSEEEQEPFGEKMQRLTTELATLQTEGEQLDSTIRSRLKEILDAV